MQNSSHRIAVAALALISLSAPALSAQATSPRVSVDGAVGAGSGRGGGQRVDRSLIATELLVAIQINGDARQGFLVGFDASSDRQLNGDLLCLLSPDGRCIPQYPGFGAVGMVGGYQWRRSSALRLRVLGGPGYYTAYFDQNSTTSHSVGVGGRTDVGVRLFGPVSATLAVRGAWIPNIRGQSYVPNAVMFGLRLETGG